MKKKILTLTLTGAMLGLTAVPTFASNKVFVDGYTFDDLCSQSVTYDLNSDGNAENISFKSYGIFSEEMNDNCSRNEIVINDKAYFIRDVRHGHYEQVFFTDIDQTDNYLDIVLIDSYKGKNGDIYRFDGNNLVQVTGDYFNAWNGYWDFLRQNPSSFDFPSVSLTVSDSRTGTIGFTFNCGDEAYSYLKESDLVYKQASNPIDMTVPFVQPIKVLLNGKEIEFDQEPIMIDERVMVPIRAVFEAMGYEVGWDENTQTASSVKGSDLITVQINNNIIEYKINGESHEYECDVVPQIISERTLVPVRAISESAGYDVDWDGENASVIITSKEVK